MKYNHTWEEVEHAGRLYNVEFSIDYDVTPYRPARINCDPDDAYPAEGGEVNINGIKVLSVVGAYRDSKIKTISAKGVSDLEKLYWTKRFEKEEITSDFMIELAEHAAADDEAAREGGT